MTAIKKFLADFQDMYVDKEVFLNTDDTDLTTLELKQLDKYIKRITTDISELSELTYAASTEAKQHYLNLLKVLEDKIDYLGDTADVYNYINSYFDMRTVHDMYNFNLRENKSPLCIYDYNQKGLTLKSKSSLHKCAKDVEGSSIVFYNTNNSYHSGLHITSPYLSILTLKQLSIRRSDGTVLELDITTTEDNEYYINHENLQSAQIIIQFESTITDETLNTYLHTVDLNLINYEYNVEGSLPLGSTEMNTSDLFSIIVESELKNNTYANLNLGVEVLDINGQVIDTINTTIALNNTLVCKRLDQINFQEVDEIVSLVVKNKKTKTNLTESYLNSLEFKHEKYILYTPKDLKENEINKYLKKLGQSSFKINTKVAKRIIFSPTVELYSFQSNASPLIKHVTGVMKNETI